MLKFYFIGYLIAFIMLSIILFQSKFWEEETIGIVSEQNIELSKLAAVTACLLLSLLSWVMVGIVFIKTYYEKRSQN